jgi:hypothetical protein
MLKRRSVAANDGTIWQSIKQEAAASDGASGEGVAVEQVRVTFQCGARMVDVLLPPSWPDQTVWPDWVIVGEIERELKGA